MAKSGKKLISFGFYKYEKERQTKNLKELARELRHQLKLFIEEDIEPIGMLSLVHDFYGWLMFKSGFQYGIQELLTWNDKKL